MKISDTQPLLRTNPSTHEMARTKIVATIGPASSTMEVIKGMIVEGMSVARMNFSHGTLKEKAEHMDLVRGAARELGVGVGLMSDLQGPEVRTHMGRKELKVEEGDVVTVSGKEGLGEVKIKPASVLRGLEEGDELYIDEGRIKFIFLSPVELDLDYFSFRIMDEIRRFGKETGIAIDSS